MALTITKTANPYKVTGTTATDAEITSETVWIQKIIWYNVTAAADLLSLVDKAGNTLLALTCDGASNYTCDFPMGLAVSGIHCDDMDSGSLLIYLKA